jgi:hypothetical protein
MLLDTLDGFGYRRIHPYARKRAVKRVRMISSGVNPWNLQWKPLLYQSSKAK